MNWKIIVGSLFTLSGITRLFKDPGNALFSIALGGALLYWGVKQRGKSTAKKSSLSKQRTLTEETFHAVGVSYYEDSIRKLANINPDWKLTSDQIIKNGGAGKSIFKNNYVNKPVKLLEEPQNPHDRNAVAVIIADELVGYISREDNLRVKEILNKRDIKSLSGFIGGGEYKIVDENGDIAKDSLGFSVSVRIKYV